MIINYYSHDANNIHVYLEFEFDSLNNLFKKKFEDIFLINNLWLAMQILIKSDLI